MFLFIRGENGFDLKDVLATDYGKLEALLRGLFQIFVFFPEKFPR